MKTELEDRLTESMHHQVDGIALTSDVLDRAERRHRSHTIKVRSAYALGVLGLAGALTAGVTLSGTPAARPAVQAESASMRLASAAVASDNISYRLRLTTSLGTRYEGAFDPRTDTGYVRMPQDDSVVTELLINGTRYMGGEPPQTKLPADKGRGETYGRYGVYPGKFDRLSLYDGGDAVQGAASPDPAALFKALASAHASTSRNPDGTLHFEYATPRKDGSTTTAGDVTLNADGRITKVAIVETWSSTAKGRLATGTYKNTLELSDYNLKVTVKRPTDVVPAT